MRPSPLKPTVVVTFDTTDAQIVRPYNRYSSAGLTTDALRLDTPVRPYSGYTSDLSNLSL